MEKLHYTDFARAQSVELIANDGATICRRAVQRHGDDRSVAATADEIAATSRLKFFDVAGNTIGETLARRAAAR